MCTRQPIIESKMPANRDIRLEACVGPPGGAGIAECHRSSEYHVEVRRTRGPPMTVSETGTQNLAILSQPLKYGAFFEPFRKDLPRRITQLVVARLSRPLLA